MIREPYWILWIAKVLFVDERVEIYYKKIRTEILRTIVFFSFKKSHRLKKDFNRYLMNIDLFHKLYRDI